MLAPSSPLPRLVLVHVASAWAIEISFAGLGHRWIAKVTGFGRLLVAVFLPALAVCAKFPTGRRFPFAERERRGPPSILLTEHTTGSWRGPLLALDFARREGTRSGLRESAVSLSRLNINPLRSGDSTGATGRTSPELGILALRGADDVE
jgi:hypothetical protein